MKTKKPMYQTDANTWEAKRPSKAVLKDRALKAARYAREAAALKQQPKPADCGFFNDSKEQAA